MRYVHKALMYGTISRQVRKKEMAKVSMTLRYTQWVSLEKFSLLKFSFFLINCLTYIAVTQLTAWSDILNE